MSSLDVALHERIRVMRHDVYIGADVLRKAQDAAGLNNREISDALYTSLRTWQRWKSTGYVPAPLAGNVARLLNIEVEIPPRSGPSSDADAKRVQAELETVRDGLREATQRLEDLQSRLDQIEPVARTSPLV